MLIALAAPVLGVRWGFPDEGNNPSGSTTREAYELATRGFGPGANGPLVVAVEHPDGSERELAEPHAPPPRASRSRPRPA